mmetsp:Transcript_2537/g.6748  ORF Transcript_2537/g.6748 Transcript_2537/m.6748 type:complete len:223 (+) Transcript_2537:99-767(+)
MQSLKYCSLLITFFVLSLAGLFFFLRPPTKPLRVLAVGDSLTAGFLHGGSQFSPYTRVLETYYGPRGVAIDNWGRSGATIAQIRSVLESGLENATAREYGFVVLLAGTNDLGMGSSRDAMVGGLEAMYELALGKAEHLVVLTIPDAAFGGERYLERRKEVNEWIKGFAEEHARVSCVDLETEIQYGHVIGKEMFDDGLHFSEKGYWKMGELVYEAMRKAQKT